MTFKLKLKLTTTTLVNLLAPSIALASSSTGTPLDGLVSKIAGFVSGPVAFLMLIAGVGSLAWTAVGNNGDVSSWIKGLVGIVSIIGVVMGVAGFGRSYMGIGAEVVAMGIGAQIIEVVTTLTTN